ncbi:MAG: hypothetical protein L7F78_21695 [Syntrophales bacterium LBB04]|nr:hypothetical protein [Syntrophales bacterium LBB04]
MVKSIHPEIGGRLRLAHEQNQQISITTEVIRYDESVAVVRAVTTTMKGTFPGIGMASVEREHTIAPAILELAETRSIARSLRFAGYEVEYCSAEEISLGSVMDFLKMCATIANMGGLFDCWRRLGTTG